MESGRPELVTSPSPLITEEKEEFQKKKSPFITEEKEFQKKKLFVIVIYITFWRDRKTVSTPMSMGKTSRDRVTTKKDMKTSSSRCSSYF